VIEIRNLMFQPLALHLAGEEGGIHLGSRERMTIPEDQVSDEMRVAASRGFVSLAQVRETTQPDPHVDTAEREHDVVPAGDDRAPAKPKKGKQA
jgi:hypothetical protein